MCTYLTERAEIEASGKSGGGWIALDHVTVYFDHPYHSSADHTLNLDFTNDEIGPSSRIAIELTAEAARSLLSAMSKVLEDPEVAPLVKRS